MTALMGSAEVVIFSRQASGDFGFVVLLDDRLAQGEMYFGPERFEWVRSWQVGQALAVVN